MSDFLPRGSRDDYHGSQRALDSLNRDRAAMGRPLLTPWEFEQRCHWMQVYRDGETREERAAAAAALRRQDRTAEEARAAARGCPPEIREQIRRLLDRTYNPDPNSRGGDAKSFGEIMRGDGR
jgi:hypothetical protein